MFNNKIYKSLSVFAFGRIVDKNIEHFKPLKTQLDGAGISVMLKTWVSMILLTSTLIYIATLLAGITLTVMLGLSFILSIYTIVLAPIFVASVSFFIFYVYPMQKAKSIKNDIENNLPFALAHMSAIVSSGIPPEYMFDMLTDFDEYGGIAENAKMIIRNIRTFGMSSTRAINAVASKTPSQIFSQTLMGISTTIEKGGNLTDYIKQMSDKSLFEYSIRREKYLKTLSTYADIYTALLVAAPLMMLAVLGVMGIIGGEVLGLSINDLVTVITWLILPIVNASFLAFIHMTYPGI